MEVILVLGAIIVLFVIFSKGQGPRPHKGPLDYVPIVHKPRRDPVPPPATPAFSSINAPVLQGMAYVTDGDSLIIQKTEIRLFGVDAPEMNHPFGKQAKWALHKLCKGQMVRAECVEIDTHGRTVARCTLPDGRDLSAEMVKLGLAIDWAKFSGGRYRALEVPDARKKMWLADARQKGHMHLWRQFDERRKRSGT